MKTALIILFFFTHYLSLFCQEAFIQKYSYSPFTIQFKSDTISFIVFNKNLTRPKPTIVLIQGSGAMPLFLFDKNRKDTLSLFPLDFRPYLDSFNIVLVQKKGTLFIDDIEKDYFNASQMSLVFMQHDNVESYVRRYKQVIKHLRKQKWVKKQQIYVVGHSSGYRIAAALAQGNRQVAKVVCMSANPFNRFGQFVSETRIKQFSTISNDTIVNQAIDSLYMQFKSLPLYDLKAQPLWIQYYIKNEISHNYKLTIFRLLKINVPLLIVYGRRDIGSLDNDLVPYFFESAHKTNLTIKSYPDLEHNYFKLDKDNKIIERHWKDVFKDVVDWLAQP